MMSTIERSVDVDVPLSEAKVRLTEFAFARTIGYEGLSDLAFTPLDDALQSGVFTFVPLDGSRCRVTLSLEYDPREMPVGSSDLTVRGWVQGYLEKFRRFAEGGKAEPRQAVVGPLAA